uniref:Uncharacterized protein n=1 Tax=Strongyloides venezuelensis TaxID=75913 RepID=A0A0K0EY57_STRVS
MNSKIIYNILLLFLLFESIISKKLPIPCKRTIFSRRTTNYKAWREQMIICELLVDNKYKKTERPNGMTAYNRTAGPVLVKTSMWVESISAVSEKNMEFVAQFRFQQRWYDERLEFIRQNGFKKDDYLNVERDQILWQPDTFFQNERNGWYHTLDQENKFLKVNSDGLITYNRRLTLILACNMHLKKYPMDKQKCLIDFASYAYTTEDIIYEWDINGVTISPTANGALPNFEIESFEMASCDSITNTGKYSCLRVVITLNRVFSFFLLQLYIPSAMLVGVSWVSYWIDWKSTAARVPLAIVTLLTMITQSHAINSNLPPVSYAKAIDVWIGACVVFIFASLIEYAVVNYMGILDEHRQIKKIASNHTRLTSVVDTNRIINKNKYENRINILNEPNLNNKKPTKKSKIASSIRDRRRTTFADTPIYHDEGLDIDEDINTNKFYTESEDIYDYSMQKLPDLVYIGQRKKVELVKWCSLLSSRKRAERIDIIARLVVPIAFFIFNIVYWNFYLNDMMIQSFDGSKSKG